MDRSEMTVLVTGANRGIGFEVCRQLAQKGHTVILSARSKSKAEEAARRLSAAGLETIPTLLDVTAAATINQARDLVAERFGSLDALVNNAAIDYDSDQHVATASGDRVRAIFDVNFFGVWEVSQAFLPLLRKSDHPRIVNVSSRAGAIERLGGGAPGYSLSKVSLNGLTISLANSLRSSGILVNAVCPGWTATGMAGSGGRPISEGAKGVVWATLLPDDGPTGGFFRDQQRIPW